MVQHNDLIQHLFDSFSTSKLYFLEYNPHINEFFLIVFIKKRSACYNLNSES